MKKLLIYFMFIFVLGMSVMAYDLGHTIKSEGVGVDGVNLVFFSDNDRHQCITDQNGYCGITGVTGSSQEGFYTLMILKSGYYSKTVDFIYVDKNYNYVYDIEEIPENAWPERYIVEEGDAIVKIEMLDKLREYEEYDYINSEISLENVGTSGNIDFNDYELGGVFARTMDGKAASWGQIPTHKAEDTSLSIAPGGKIKITYQGKIMKVCLTKGSAMYKGQYISVNSLTCLEEEKVFNIVPKGVQGTYYMHAEMKFYKGGQQYLAELDTDSFEVIGATEEREVPPFIELDNVLINGTVKWLGEEISDNITVGMFLIVRNVDTSTPEGITISVSSNDYTNIQDYDLIKMVDNPYYTHIISWDYLDADSNGRKTMRITVTDEKGLTDYIEPHFIFRKEEKINISSKNPEQGDIIIKENMRFNAVATSYYPLSFHWYLDGINVLNGPSNYDFSTDFCNGGKRKLELAVRSMTKEEKTSWNITCDMNGIIINELKPFSQQIQLKDSAVKFLTDYSHRFGYSVDHYWLIDGERFEELEFLFESKDYEPGMHTVFLNIYEVDNMLKNYTKEYSIFVINSGGVIVEEFKIESYYPMEDFMSYSVGSNVDFNLTTNKESAIIKWYVDEIKVGEGIKLSYKFDKVKNYLVKAVVENGDQKIEKEWTARIINEYIPFEIKSKIPSSSVELKEPLEIMFSLDVSYSYLKPVITWEYKGANIQSETYKHFFDCSDLGENIVKAIVNDGLKKEEISWDVKLLENDICDGEKNLEITSFSSKQKGDTLVLVVDVMSKVKVEEFKVKINDEDIMVKNEDGLNRIVHIISEKDLPLNNKIGVLVDPENKVEEVEEEDNKVDVPFVFIKSGKVQDLIVESVDFTNTIKKDNYFYAKIKLKNERNSAVSVSYINVKCEELVVKNGAGIINANSLKEFYIKGKCSDNGGKDVLFSLILEDGGIIEHEEGVFVLR